MSDAGPVWVTVAQRDTFDELERKSLHRDGGWVPVREISRLVELGTLVGLGLVEMRCAPPDHSEASECVYRRVVDVPFVVALPKGNVR
jgi:hypothetical protein